MSNIDEFNQIVGQVLNQLYESFPIRINLQADDPTDAYKAAMIYVDTVKWLEQEGFIVAAVKQQPEGAPAYTTFIDVVLTAKGLTILNVTSGVEDNKKLTTGAQLGKAVRDNSQDGIKHIVNQIISATVSGQIKG